MRAQIFQATWPLSYGDALLQWPSEMTEQDREQFTAWLEFIKQDIASRPRPTLQQPATLEQRPAQPGEEE